MKPCPCCGSTARPVGSRSGINPHWKLCRVICDRCGLTTANHSTPEEAAAAWNTRATPPRAEVDVAVRDVLAERDKQRAKWGDAHDDKHSDGALSAAAAVLAHPEVDGVFGPDWAFELRVKHDNDDRTRRVIAAALLLAEIERLDRRALARATGGNDAT